MNRFIDASLGDVMNKLVQRLRPLPKDSVIANWRYPVEVWALVELFHRVCRPMAMPRRPGVSLFDLRLMAIAATIEQVPNNTPAWVQIIECTLTDPALAAHKERHHLVSTLLDAQIYSALELACAYPEPWEAKITMDEINTYQRIVPGILGRLKLVGMILGLDGLRIAYLIQCAFRYMRRSCRLSFTGVLPIVQDAVMEFQIVLLDPISQLYNWLLADIAQQHLPERRPCLNPRVVKRKMFKFNCKRSESYNSLQPTIPFWQAVAFIEKYYG